MNSATEIFTAFLLLAVEIKFKIERSTGKMKCDESRNEREKTGKLEVKREFERFQ